jgi:hypothetical protein
MAPVICRERALSASLAGLESLFHRVPDPTPTAITDLYAIQSANPRTTRQGSARAHKKRPRRSGRAMDGYASLSAVQTWRAKWKLGA